MVDKENEETTSLYGEEAEVWGTLEELLLACAVNRHGTTSWDSIAKELQKRMKHSFAFSPQNCKQKYDDLKRRFHVSSATAVERENGDDEEDFRDEQLLLMVDELRKLRVEELRREVQRHDLSIVSLQLKVKGFEEEREKSSPKGEEPGVSDLRTEPDGNATGTGVKADELERSSPERFDSADDRSFNESNSSSHNKKSAGLSLAKKERESESTQREQDEKVEPDPVQHIEPPKESGSASRPGEWVSESKRESGKKLQQQSSDVHSSASQSNKKRRRFRGLEGSSGDELEAEEVSPANKRISVKFQPLIRFLDILRSHKHGSVFQRRLPSQETEKYRNVIRQHMDLDTVQSKIDNGIYRDCHPKFYLDLLLIFTNAVLFYRKSSAEHLAARELRKLVVNQIHAQTTRKPDKIRPDPEPVVKKPRSSTTSVIVCRRRSSTAMQVLSESMKNNHKNDKRVLENGKKEEKPKVDGGDSKRRENEKKLVTRERSALRSGGLRLIGNKNKKIITKEAANKREKVGKSINDAKKEEISISREGTTRKQTRVLKKQGMANFLNRMKQNSPSSQEKAKKDESEEEGEEEEEEERERRKKTMSSGSKKKDGNVKRSANKDSVDVVASRRNPTRRGEREAAATRRAGGRPPKRTVAMSSCRTLESGNRGRSSGRDGDEKSKKKPRR